MGKKMSNLVEIYSKSLVRAIGKVLARTSIKIHEGDQKCPLFVKEKKNKEKKEKKKQPFLWSASITLDKNNNILPDI